MLVEIETVAEGLVAIVRLMRPHVLNALDGPLLDELDHALDNIAARQEVRIMILTGSDICFSVGADLKEELLDREARIARMHGLVERLASFPVLSIAAIEGWALGGGLELAMACTFRVAAPDAKLGLPEIKLGVIPSYGGTQLTPRLLGATKALELLCFGEPIGAKKAEKIGLINWLSENKGGALALANERAAMLVRHSPAALLAIRSAVFAGENMALPQSLVVEARISGQLLKAENPPDAAKNFRSRPDTSVS